MTDKDRLQWLFEEFLKMETKYEAAAEELREIKASPRFFIAQEVLKRRHRGGSKRKGQ